MSREEQRILQLLTDHIGSWVDSRSLSLIALQYPRVVKQLRERGHVILNHVDRVGRKSVRGSYMLCTARQAVAVKIGRNTPVGQREREAAANDDTQPALFDFAPTHRDE